MVIGSGLIGTRFRSLTDNDIIIFASGVSNSKSASDADFERERHIVENTRIEYKNKLFVYFSTYSIDDPDLMDTKYVCHKKNIESLICAGEGDYLIIRTSNIVGRNLYNPHTILNFLYHKIRNNESFDCWSTAERNLLDIDHLFEMVIQVLKLPLKNQIIYLVNPACYKVPDIIDAFSRLLQRIPHFNAVPKGEKFSFDTTLSKSLFSKLNINSTHYLQNLLFKYYSNEAQTYFNCRGTTGI